MTALAPNPHSPFADADPRYRHLLAIPVFFPAPDPGVLCPAACDRLTVVPEQPAETDADADLPDGLCPICVAAMRTGRPLADTRALGPCRECGTATRHEGLCALCRQEQHDAWWPTRDRANTTPETGD